ncbi:alpha/beta fold hydrolase [Arenimonas caeni]|jgi:pimeloyl-ACP methyl ester carboxylesterase|uniref:Alpha/beta hydrolase n=1 Tax=Arenimonas caeni TaxID=2058085 RepID=A0A2P6M6V4_9GAMM|nr:alpha/beta hydrolase [Arenimonas caeni]MDY0020865.1 alpha/beta hydrolase [Arenimonas caeni]PRH81741.1 alpha/beta hydrolase [Arenimonas caeni]
MQEIRLRTASGTLAALRGGDPSGPRLLCLHGWLDNAASFLPLAPHLAGFDWVALDLPGHGASDHRPPGCDYAFADWLHDGLDALDALGWEQADLLGHSMGGAIASFIAAAVPARVRRLALVEALGPVAGDPEKAGERLREAVRARRARAGRPPRLIPDVDTAVAARLAVTRMAPEAAALIVRRNLREVPGGFAWRSDPRLTLPGHLRMDEAAVQAVLRGIEAPVLVVAADPAPPYFTPGVRAARLACLREARLAVLAGGHHLHMEQPGVVAPLLLDFLRG